MALNANRHVSGVLRGFDQFMNIVLDNAVDEKNKTDIGMVVSAPPLLHAYLAFKPESKHVRLGKLGQGVVWALRCMQPIGPEAIISTCKDGRMHPRAGDSGEQHCDSGGAGAALSHTSSPVEQMTPCNGQVVHSAAG